MGFHFSEVPGGRQSHRDKVGVWIVGGDVEQCLRGQSFGTGRGKEVLVMKVLETKVLEMVVAWLHSTVNVLDAADRALKKWLRWKFYVMQTFHN